MAAIKIAAIVQTQLLNRLGIELGFMIRRYALIELNEPKTREIAEGLFLCDNTHQNTLSEHSSEAGIAHVALHLTVSNIPRKRNLMPDKGSGTFTRKVQEAKNSCNIASQPASISAENRLVRLGEKRALCMPALETR